MDSINKFSIPVPTGIRYISEWSNFKLDLLCDGPYIINKQIPGCGFTEYCLTSPENVIICSPRKILLENKESQHLGEVFYAKNENDSDIVVDKSIGKPSKKNKLPYQVFTNINDTNFEVLDFFKQLEIRLIDYCTQRTNLGKPIKILVTYDSFKYIKRILMSRSTNLFNLFYTVVDEFQSIFIDSKFKADIEFGFIKELRGLKKVCFVSATPMIDGYLRRIDIFKNLPYFELDWVSEDPSRVMKPELKIRKTKSIHSEMKRIIEEYKSGNYSVLANPLTGEIVQSREAVFYVNSVNDILGIIKKAGLLPGEVNILCSNNPTNISKLKNKLGKGFQIGSVPLRGEPHKMFTFCTRTVYLGADFYSTCARTFILSDANIDSLSVDISLDLPQILGRQRLLENPWKNHAEFYFKTLGESGSFTKEDFDNYIFEKDRLTNGFIESFFKMSKDGKDAALLMCCRNIIDYNYISDYVSVSYINGEYLPVRNELVKIAEQRAFDVQQIDYKDRFTVFSVIRGNFKVDKLSQYIEKLRDTRVLFTNRLRYLCETQDLTDDEKKLVASQASEFFDKYYNILGPVRCKALGYDPYLLKKEIQDLQISTDTIFSEISKFFQVGKKYTNKEAKETIREIFNRLGYSKSPKASILNDYYELKITKALSKEGKWENGFEILGLRKI